MQEELISVSKAIFTDAEKDFRACRTLHEDACSDLSLSALQEKYRPVPSPADSSTDLNSGSISVSRASLQSVQACKFLTLLASKQRLLPTNVKAIETCRKRRSIGLFHCLFLLFNLHEHPSQLKKIRDWLLGNSPYLLKYPKDISFTTLHGIFFKRTEILLELSKQCPNDYLDLILAYTSLQSKGMDLPEDMNRLTPILRLFIILISLTPQARTPQILERLVAQSPKVLENLKRLCLLALGPWIEEESLMHLLDLCTQEARLPYGNTQEHYPLIWQLSSSRTFCSVSLDLEKIGPCFTAIVKIQKAFGSNLSFLEGWDPERITPDVLLTLGEQAQQILNITESTKQLLVSLQETEAEVSEPPLKRPRTGVCESGSFADPPTPGEGSGYHTALNL